MKLSEMTDEAKRVAIAEACGWTRELGPEHGPDALVHGLKVFYFSNERLGIKRRGQPWPDYLASLDAMHEAEKTLTDETAGDEFSRYCRTLSERLCPIDCKGSSCGFTIRATAAQRADAFLLAKNLATP